MPVSAMTPPEKMTDEQLIERREIVSCVESEDRGWDAILSCGHEVTFVIEPHLTQAACAQCLDVLIERSRKRGK
jgi:xanthine/CO dehydrogenase XdhC/CoxF family maturation factor